MTHMYEERHTCSRLRLPSPPWWGKVGIGGGGEWMRRHLFVWLIVATVVTLLGVDALAQSKPEGQLIIAFDTSIAATYFDPAETAGLQTPFVFLYAPHDALVKPLPGDDQAPSLAESWTESPDGLVYEFTLRQGVDVPQRRSVQRRGCAIQLPPLQ